jgi:hypothetical protein
MIGAVIVSMNPACSSGERELYQSIFAVSVVTGAAGSGTGSEAVREEVSTYPAVPIGAPPESR